MINKVLTVSDCSSMHAEQETSFPVTLAVLLLTSLPLFLTLLPE